MRILEKPRIALKWHTPNPEFEIESAGRVCWASWGRSDGSLQCAQDFIRRLRKVGHIDVLEEAEMSVWIECSRVASHQIVRHRTQHHLQACFDEETEVLTYEGWKPWPKIDQSDILGTYNPTTGELEYQKPSHLYIYDYDGKMYKVENQNVDLLVTPNHRMWVRKYNGENNSNKKKFEVILAERLFSKRVEYQKGANWTGISPEFIDIKSTSRTFAHGPKNQARGTATREFQGVSFPTRPFVKFLAYYITEGHLGQNQIILSQNPGPIQNDMINTLKELGLRATVIEGTVTTSCLPLYDFLKEEVGSPSYNKRIPKIIGELSPELIQLFLDTHMAGDGTLNRNSKKLYTSSASMIDELQILTIKAGYSSNVKVYDQTGTTSYIGDQLVTSRRPMYYLHILRPENCTPLVNHGGRTQDGFVDYSGKVYCASVPNGLLFVRRNGKVIVSGNSQRYIKAKEAEIMLPPALRNNGERAIFVDACQKAFDTYEKLTEAGVRKEDARFILPNATLTVLKAKANFNNWRHFFDLRSDSTAQWEVRQISNSILSLASKIAPAVFEDQVERYLTPEAQYADVVERSEFDSFQGESEY